MSKVLVDREVLLFLNGETELEGLGFGERQEGKPFWWRKYLREALAQPAEAEGASIQLTGEYHIDCSYLMNLVDGQRAALSAVTAERDAANSRLHEVAVACATAEQERNQLRAEVEALRKDAERYRWLRYADLDALAEANWGLEGEVYQGDEFDRAIDAAMAAKEA